jgi:hypothetical protein
LRTPARACRAHYDTTSASVLAGLQEDTQVCSHTVGENKTGRRRLLATRLGDEVKLHSHAHKSVRFYESTLADLRLRDICFVHAGDVSTILARDQVHVR